MKRLLTNLGLLQIFAAMLLVIVIMLGSNYIVYKNSIAGIYEKVSENNALGIKSIINSFDNSFRTINNIIHTVHFSPYSNIMTGNQGEVDMYEVYTFQENIASLISSLNYIEDLVVFYDNENIAITAKGTTSFDHLFNNKYKHHLYNANYWRTVTKSNHSLTMFPADNFKILTSISTQTNKKLIVAMAGNKIRMSNKNILVLIDAEAFMEQVDQQTMLPGSSLIVLDQNRNIVLNTGEEIDLLEILNDVYFDSTHEGSLKRENFDYTFYQSDYNDYIYINKVPYQFQNISEVMQANNSIMITGIICAIILAIFLSIYLNKPVKGILRQLGGGYSRGNDFNKIHSGIVKIQQENVAYKEELQFVSTKTLKGVLFELIDDQPNSLERDATLKSYHAELFKGMPYFIMLAIQVNCSEGEHAQSLKMRDIMTLIETELEQAQMIVNIFYMGNLQFLVLMGLNSGEGRREAIRDLRIVLPRINRNVASQHMSLTASVSNSYASEADHCKHAYRDVIKGLHYRGVNETAHVIDSEEISYTWNVYFPFDKLERLSNLLLSGHIDEGIEIIREVINENETRNVHHHQLEQLSKSLFLYMFRNAVPSANENNEIYALETTFLQKVEQAHDAVDFEEALIDVAKYVAEKSNKAEEQSKLNPNFIARYIELHYMNNLYLDHMAEVHETTPKYFSNYFKRTFGVNYVEYLNNVRLSHAKEFLRDTTWSISDISEKVGYMNASTFTSTFKKYFGISPSEYRRNVENN